MLSAAMAEWLRRLTRNQMGSSRVGSNPTRSEGNLPTGYVGSDRLVLLDRLFVKSQGRGIPMISKIYTAVIGRTIRL